MFIILGAIYLGCAAGVWGCYLVLRPLRPSPLHELKFRPYHAWCLRAIPILSAPPFLVLGVLLVTRTSPSDVLLVICVAMVSLLLISPPGQSIQRHARRQRLVARLQTTEEPINSDDLVEIILYHVKEWPYRPLVVRAECDSYAQRIRVGGASFLLSGEDQVNRTMLLLAASGRFGFGAQVPMQVTIEGRRDQLPAIKWQLGTPYYRA